MNELLKRFQPTDLIAIVVIVGAFILKFFGIDGTVGSALMIIIAFYFGKRAIYDEVKTLKPHDAKAKTVEQQVREIAEEMGVDPSLAVRVAKCESGLNCAAVNKNATGSIDRGLFQWNNKWHPEVTDTCAYDLVCSTRVFCKAANEGHLSWWNASKKCWDI